MNLSLALATAALLAAEPSNLPPNHPPMGSRPAATSGAAGMPSGALPEGHPPAMTGRAPPSAEELLNQLDSTPGLVDRDKSFEIASSLGRLYYSNARPSDAILYFLQAEEKAKATRELFLAQRKKLGKAAVPGAEEAGCGFTPNMSVEAMGAVAQERAKKGDTAGAAACARAALEPVLEVEAMRGHALFLSGDMAGALAVYGRVLEVAPSHEEALFSRSALLYETQGDDLKALKTAREGFEAFITVYPDSPRAGLARKLSRMAAEAVQAGGLKKMQASRVEDRRIRASKLDLTPRAPMMGQAPMAGRGPQAGGASAPTLSQETMEAAQNVERTPELEAQLTKQVEVGEAALAQGRYDEALAAYRQVMPLRPDGRVKAGLAWTLIRLGKPTAERVWGVAVDSDPAAVDQLGDTLKAKGDASGAKQLWERLAASAPDYAGKASLQAKLSQ
jgi:tetratricopeptide (TPR) repeat protein